MVSIEGRLRDTQKMNFCHLCDNTVTLVLDDTASPTAIKEQCLSCGVQRPLSRGCHLIFENSSTSTVRGSYEQFVTKDIFLDPTIAKLDTSCPHCRVIRSVKYAKFGAGLDFLYACSVCNTFWVRIKGGEHEIVRRLA